MKVLYQIKLDPNRHQETGGTRHFDGASRISGIANLQIAQFESGGGFYLLYLNSDFDELTDTIHASIPDAMEQAKFEFAVATDEWQKMN